MTVSGPTGEKDGPPAYAIPSTIIIEYDCGTITGYFVCPVELSKARMVFAVATEGVTVG
jgi:hypothetical protein